MKITVVGTGHGGCAMAAVLSQHQQDVSLLKLTNAIHNDNFSAIRQQRGIHLKGIEGEGFYPIIKASTEPEAVIPDADVILVFYVANFHEQIAERISPFLNKKQIVVINPGYGGSLLFEKHLKKLGKPELPLFVEFETLPYSSRITQPGEVSIVSRNVRHPFAAYPASRNDEAYDLLTPVIGECVPRQHLLEVALHNPNLVIHTVGVLMNASLVESPKQDFAMYRDGFSPTVWKVAQQLDKEKMDVLEAMNAERISYFQEFKLRTFADIHIDDIAGFQHYANEAPPGPFTVNHRYVTEDVPVGLGLMQSLGRHLKVPTPVCDSLITLSCAMLPEQPLAQDIRSLEKLGEHDIQQLLRRLTA